jgi:glycine cleavage system H lipoate-binding protein
VVKINPLFVDEENRDFLVSEPYRRGWLFVVQTEKANEKV